MSSWKQLKFNRSKEEIVDNFLLDTVKETKFIDSIYFSEYYFDSTADAEIEFAPEATGRVGAGQLGAGRLAIISTGVGLAINGTGIDRYQSPITAGDAPFGEDC